MIGTIRKHSGWLWIIIIIATIVSFIFWGVGSSKMGGGGDVSLGTVYGKPVTREAYASAQRDFYLYYWLSTGNWPDSSTMTPAEIKQGVYVRVMLTQKAENMGIQVSDDAAATAAADRLRAMSRNGQLISLDALVTQALAPKGFSAADFENYIRHDLMLEELVRAMGLTGSLVTPQEAAADYQEEHQELSAQAVFFDASNYLASVKPTAAAIAQYYTNAQASYRLPDRVQVNYVVFDPSNYLAQSRAEWAKTNLLENVEAYYHRVGDDYHGAKTAQESRTVITNELVLARAQVDAKKEADAFTAQVFLLEPVKPENLALVAKQKGLTLRQTAPFSKDTGPQEFDGSGNFTKVAFGLTPDSPLSEPVTDGGEIYVMALVKTLPSVIPSFEQLRFQVAADYATRQSILMAQHVGESFYHRLTNDLAAGKSFATACVVSGLTPRTLPPFSLITDELPDLGARASMRQLQQAAFTTPLGKPSAFQPTTDGGFILLVESKLPLDTAQMKTDLPEFTTELRRSRENEAFNEWLQTEAGAHLQMPKSE
jgi:hypothetical protein